MTTKLKTAPKPETQRGGPDLHDRLISFTKSILGISACLETNRASASVAERLLQHSLGAYFAHGEAEGSPSAKEFTEKFRGCLKELRLLRRALMLLEGNGPYTPATTNGLLGLVEKKDLVGALEELDVIIRIFFSSIRTLEGTAHQ